MRNPLGAFEEFSRWSGRAFPWGPDQRCRAWFGGEVVGQLAALLDEHAARVAAGPRHGEPVAAALGCSPWLDNRQILDRLAQRPACVVVAKALDRQGLPPWPLRYLADSGVPFPMRALPELQDLAPLEASGERFVVTPHSHLPSEGLELGPVRVVGYRPPAQGRVPILHSKLIVLGELVWVDEHPSGALVDEQHFFPWGAWFGSANLTAKSAHHLEMAVWVEDPDFCRLAVGYLCSLIAFSEPLGADTVWPEPEMTAVQWDDAAFAEYMAEYGGDPDDEG